MDLRELRRIVGKLDLGLDKIGYPSFKLTEIIKPCESNRSGYIAKKSERSVNKAGLA